MKANLSDEEAAALEAQKFDPLYEAEKIAGRDTKESTALGFGLLQLHSADMRDRATALRDTHYRAPFSALQELAVENGFREIYSETFGQVEDVLKIWWNDGLLLVAESYNDFKSTNSCRLYFNWQPHEPAFPPRSSGGFVRGADGELVRPEVFSGNYDGRELLFTHIKRLKAGGTILPKWVAAPFLWLLNYEEPKVEGYDYREINARKIAQLPPEVREAMGVD
jgi:hypothetical protein